ncbi:ParA family protein [Mycolicibacterium mageritense]|uniref:ParA family protein n=1 Tax=Mycolicibacterium mageritense TaxID=53462 RepID=UPI001E2B87AA|nr:ParA family protein [Mycolicibacterium mageritense]GJJ23593.1 chromosome partitioning protein ParA [Mycolicibacterium mageritense]
MMTEMTAPAHTLASVVSTPYQVIAFANGKGGVGKTSISANLAGLFGLGGYRVLLVELDPQGNCARDFGLPVAEYESIKDVIEANGEQHAAALIVGSATPPIYTNVRPNVDLIAGGGGLERIYKYYAANAKQSLAEGIRREIIALGRTYDLILIDAPPVDITALEAVLRVAGTVVIPVKADDASIDGLSTIADLFGPAQLENPWLRLGGVARFGLGSQSTGVAARVFETIEQILGGVAPIFEAIIRHSDRASFDARRHGLLAHELESASSDAKAKRFAALRSGQRLGDDVVGTGAGTSKGLAEDYENLAAEVLGRMNELISENATSGEER